MTWVVYTREEIGGVTVSHAYGFKEKHDALDLAGRLSRAAHSAGSNMLVDTVRMEASPLMPLKIRQAVKKENFVEIHQSVASSIKTHSLQQHSKGNYEAVGFVLRRHGEDLAVATMPLHNHAPDPGKSFFVEPWEQFKATMNADTQGYAIMGVYHSHCNSEALPSASDHKFAHPDWVSFIYSVPFDELKAYRRVDEYLEPLEIRYA